MEQLTPQQELYRKIGRRTGWAFFALTALTGGVQLLAGAAIGYYLPAMTQPPLWLTWLLSFAPLYCVAVPVFTVLLQPLPGIRTPKSRVSTGWLLGTAAAAVTLMYAGSLVGNLLNMLIGWLRGEPVLSPLEEIVTAAPMWQTFLFACVLAPIGEELTFNYLLDKTLVFGEKRAALYCALAFGLFHGNLYQFFYAFLLRLLLVRLRLRTGSVGWCIALHAFVNVIGGLVSSWVITRSQVVIAVYGLVLLALVSAGSVVLMQRRKTVPWALPCPGARAEWLFANPGAVLAWLCCAAMFVTALL
ncbi:MAG: CPBP family intramembrane metalloprotease [Oscillospiraceae bacterium]|nr:CPBP family intramembrane metalloprotease [Oscillospiraceae bacterium]